MPDGAGLGRVLIVLGITLALAGGLLLLLGRVPRLPGDLVIRRDGLVVYVPIVTMLVVSLVLTLLLNLVLGRR